MQHETIDHPMTIPQTRPPLRRLISHVRTAGALCLVAMWVDVILRHDAEEAHYLPWIELVLALYGFTFAGFSFARGRLRISDWVTLTTCLVLFSFTAYTALLVPLVWHN